VNANIRNYPEKEECLWGVYMKDIPKFSLSFSFLLASRLSFLSDVTIKSKRNPPPSLNYPISYTSSFLFLFYSTTRAPVPSFFFRAYRTTAATTTTDYACSRVLQLVTFICDVHVKRRKKRKGHFYVFVLVFFTLIISVKRKEREKTRIRH